MTDEPHAIPGQLDVNQVLELAKLGGRLRGLKRRLGRADALQARLTASELIGKLIAAAIRTGRTPQRLLTHAP